MLTRRLYSLLGLFILLLTGCGSINSPTPPAQVVGTTVYLNKQADSQHSSIVSFTLEGAAAGNYTIQATTALSMLRHGHKEFTIDIAEPNEVFFLAFYGYQGPGTYHLAEDINGGDVHLALGTQASWDLASQAGAQCLLTVTQDAPTSTIGVDHMTGSFSCPQLVSNGPHKLPPVRIVHGTFTIAMLVVS